MRDDSVCPRDGLINTTHALQVVICHLFPSQSRNTHAMYSKNTCSLFSLPGIKIAPKLFSCINELAVPITLTLSFTNSNTVFLQAIQLITYAGVGFHNHFAISHHGLSNLHVNEDRRIMLSNKYQNNGFNIHTKL